MHIWWIRCANDNADIMVEVYCRMLDCYLGCESGVWVSRYPWVVLYDGLLYAYGDSIVMSI